MHGAVVGLSNIQMNGMAVQGELECWNIISKRIFVDSDVHRHRNFGNFNGLIGIAATKDFTPHQACSNGRYGWLVNSINRITCGRTIEENSLSPVVDVKTVEVRFLLGGWRPFNLETIGRSGRWSIDDLGCTELFTEGFHRLQEGLWKFIKLQRHDELPYGILANQAVVEKIGRSWYHPIIVFIVAFIVPHLNLRRSRA